MDYMKQADWKRVHGAQKRQTAGRRRTTGKNRGIINTDSKIRSETASVGQ
jgi:hypothetical protein